MAPYADLLERLEEIGSTSWSGTAYRYIAPSRDPLSGYGAYLNGGRWNPRESFTTIYLARPRQTCMAEFKRMARGQGRGPQSFLPRDLHTLSIRRIQILDLTVGANRHLLSLTLDDIRSDDWTPCQAVGEAAHFLGFQGLIAPSATGAGEVIAAFELKLEPGQLVSVRRQRIDPKDFE